MLETIQIHFYAIVFVIITFAKAQMDSEDMRSQNQFDTDTTPELTGTDLKLALSDLSLKDLKSLQALIDSADNIGLDYQENSSINEKLHSYDFDQQKFDDLYNDNPDEDDYSFEPRHIEDNLVNYLQRHRNYDTFTQENQRAKRDDQMLNSNDEYIKQLVYSFPQNGELNYNDNEREKSHVRVKRY